MKKENKDLIIGAALLLLGIGGYFLYCKFKKNKPSADLDKKPESKILKDAYDNLQFEFNKDVIKPSSYPFLDEVVSVLSEQPNWSLKLEGYTDNVGKEDYNLKLSKKRAEAVKKYIESKGIMPSRITAEGFGSSKPIADNKTEAGREKNRRVEFKIVKEQVLV